MYSKKVYFIPIVVVLIMYLVYQCSNKASTGTPSGRFKMYGSMRCGYTVKMLNYLRSKGQEVTFIDVNTPEGGAAFDKLNIRGVPYTIDTRTGEKISGFRKINL
jgi:glutaredoxin-related protein